MRNDEKLEIILGEEITEEMAALEKAQKHYDTAHRYIEISKFMKKFEDHNKYLTSGIKYMKKCHPAMKVKKELLALRQELFTYRAEGVIDLYEKGMAIIESATNEKDYSTAIEYFQRIVKHAAKYQLFPKYIDSELYEKAMDCRDCEDKIKYCEQKIAELRIKEKKRSRLISIVAIAVLACLVLSTKTYYFHKFTGDFLYITKTYNLAYGRYEHAYSLTKDPEKKKHLLDLSSECHYRLAAEAEKREDYASANDEYHICISRHYKDSEEKLYEMEIQVITNAELGQSVRYGKKDSRKWKVLDKQNGMALLYSKDGSTENHTLSFHSSNEPVTWEKCSLREWLNTTYYEKYFTPLEKTSIIEVDLTSDDNPVYGTSGGNNTKDKVFILNRTDYEKYFKLLGKTKHSCWLRTPGNSANTMCFVTGNKIIMDYGYEVSNTAITVKPLIWVKYQ